MTKNNQIGPLLKLVVFDWDGTLMDSTATIVACMQQAAKEVGISVFTEDEVNNIIGLGLPEAVAALMPQADSLLQSQLLDAYRRSFLAIDAPVSDLFVGAPDLFAWGQEQQLFLAIATGKSRRGLKRELDEKNLNGIFDITRCADESFSKPNPAMLQEILDFTGVEAHEALVIGDSEYDVLMAVNAGVRVVGVDYGVHSPERLIGSGAEQIFSDLASFKQYLMTNFVLPLDQELIS